MAIEGAPFPTLDDERIKDFGKGGHHAKDGEIKIWCPTCRTSLEGHKAYWHKRNCHE